MAQKLWEKSVQVNKDIERFTVGRDREMDLYLAKHDVLGSMAHITMLESIGLLTKEELSLLLAELKNIYATAESGEFVIEEGVEDVHSQVELMLTRKLGDVGKKIHSGRSRNDQVLLDLKLFTRAEIRDIAEAVEQLFHVLVMQSERYKDVLMPGYTHLQIAMPSSFGLWFGAYAESLVDDMLFLQAAFKMCNRNPLGSAAGYGSSFPLNRTMTTRLLGFDSLNYNVVYAQMGRGKMERNVAFALAKFRFPGRKLCFVIIIGAISVPGIALAVPQFLLFAKMGLTNTPWSMIIPSLVSTFGLYLMWIFSDQAVPDELLEAARVDGAGEFRTFFQISLPLLAPGIVTTALFAIVATWNNYFLPLIMLKDSNWYPLTIGLNQWKDQASTAGGQAIQNLVITGSLITIIPLVIAFLCLQKYWQSGLAAGAVKE